MKSIFLFILLYGLSAEALPSTNLIPSAVSQVIRKFYNKRSERFDLIICDSQESELSEIVNRVARKNFDVAQALQIKKVRVNETRNRINQSAVLMFDSVESYQEFHKKVEITNEYWKEFHFLVYIHDFDQKRWEEKLSKDPSYIFHFESFLILNDDGSLRLTTFKMFEQSECRKWKKFEINSFSTTTRKWEGSEFFLEKFQNFNGCELNVGIMYPASPVTNADFDTDGKLVNLWGYGMMFEQEISKRLNYVSVYNPYNSNTGKSYNPTIEDDFLLIASAQRLLYDHKYFLHISHAFTTNEDLIFITKGELYSQFEKLFLPFEAEVWFWLSVTILAAILTIIAIKFTPKHVQRFVFGRGVETPLMNLL